MDRTFTVQRTARLIAAEHCRLDELFYQLRMLWNAGLQEREDCYRKTGKSVTKYEQFKSLTEVRKFDPAYAEMLAEAQRSILSRVDLAMKAFFRRVNAGETPGFPRYKGRRNPVRSFDVPNPTIRGCSLVVKGIGRFRVKNIPRGELIMARVVKTACRIIVQFVVRRPVEPRKPDTPCAGDLGITARITLPDGTKTPGIKLDRRTLTRLQRALSRTVKGSNGRRKLVTAIAKEWNRVTVRERNASHRLTTALVAHSNRWIVEALQIGNMVRNPHLARAISEQMWGCITYQLDYKTEYAGGALIRVPPHYTSQDCSVCGTRQKMPLRKRTYRCAQCGRRPVDRDANAAQNLLLRGCAQAGWDVPPFEGAPGVSRECSHHHAPQSGQDTERHTAPPVRVESCM